MAHFWGIRVTFRLSSWYIFKAAVHKNVGGSLNRHPIKFINTVYLLTAIEEEKKAVRKFMQNFDRLLKSALAFFEQPFESNLKICIPI